MSLKAFTKVYLSILNDIPDSLEEIVTSLKDVVRSINLLQGNVDASFAPLNANIANDGIILTNIVLLGPNVNNSINHKLGRRLTGWQVIRNRAGSLVWDSQDNNKSQGTTLILNSLYNTEIDLYVF